MWWFKKEKLHPKKAGDVILSTEVIKIENEYFLARGYLAEKVDMECIKTSNKDHKVGYRKKIDQNEIVEIDLEYTKKIRHQKK